MKYELYGVNLLFIILFDVDGQLDEDVFRDEICYYFDVGVLGVVVGGSIGEGM